MRFSVALTALIVSEARRVSGTERTRTVVSTTTQTTSSGNPGEVKKDKVSHVKEKVTPKVLSNRRDESNESEETNSRKIFFPEKLLSKATFESLSLGVLAEQKNSSRKQRDESENERRSDLWHLSAERNLEEAFDMTGYLEDIWDALDESLSYICKDLANVCSVCESGIEPIGNVEYEFNLEMDCSNMGALLNGLGGAEFYFEDDFCEQNELIVCEEACEVDSEVFRLNMQGCRVNFPFDIDAVNDIVLNHNQYALGGEFDTICDNVFSLKNDASAIDICSKCESSITISSDGDTFTYNLEIGCDPSLIDNQEIYKNLTKSFEFYQYVCTGSFASSFLDCRMDCDVDPDTLTLKMKGCYLSGEYGDYDYDFDFETGDDFINVAYDKEKDFSDLLEGLNINATNVVASGIKLFCDVYGGKDSCAHCSLDYIGNTGYDVKVKNCDFSDSNMADDMDLSYFFTSIGDLCNYETFCTGKCKASADQEVVIMKNCSLGFFADALGQDLADNLMGDELTGGLDGDLIEDPVSDLTSDPFGDLTEDLGGDVTGDLDEDVTEDLFGDFSNEVPGNVTQDIPEGEELELTFSLIVEGPVDLKELEDKFVAASEEILSNEMRVRKLSPTWSQLFNDTDINSEPLEENNDDNDNYSLSASATVLPATSERCPASTTEELSADAQCIIITLMVDSISGESQIEKYREKIEVSIQNGILVRELEESGLSVPAIVLEEESPTPSPTESLPNPSKPELDPCPAHTGDCTACLTDSSCTWCPSSGVCFNKNEDVATNKADNTTMAMTRNVAPFCNVSTTTSLSVCSLNQTQNETTISSNTTNSTNEPDSSGRITQSTIITGVSFFVSALLLTYGNA